MLVIMEGTAHASYFEPVLEAMVQRGHRVHVAVETSKRGVWEELEASYRRYPSVSVGRAPDRERDRWWALVTYLRRGHDYLFQLGLRLRDVAGLVDTRREQAPSSLLWLTDRSLLRSRLVVTTLGALFARLERAVPPSEAIARWVREQRPDRVVATLPLQAGSDRPDHLRAARSVGAAAVVCCLSWKNLSAAKGRLRGEPDLLTTWNEGQSREAVELHGLPPARVVAAGAPTFDRWLGWRPTLSRAELCGHAGLDPDRPYVLYLCSGVFNRRLYGDELPLIREWVARLRASSNPRLREAGVLVRPHPQRGTRPEATDIAADGVAVWPPPEGRAADPEWRTSLFDSIEHAAAVVGLNTTAFVDSAIIGRPCLRIALPGVAPDETAHLRWLAELGGGILHVATTVDEHFAALAQALEAQAPPDNREFVEGFIRPAGADAPVAPRLVAAIEGSVPAAPAPPLIRVGRAAVRVALLPVAEGSVWLGSGSRARRARRALRRRVRRSGRRTLRRVVRGGRRRPSLPSAAAGSRRP